MARQHGNQRRTIIVDASVQKQMVVRSTLLPLAVLLVGAIGMLLISEHAFESVDDQGTWTPSLGLLVVSTIAYIVISSAVAIWLSVRQSHRVVGPAHRLKGYLERIRQGDLDFEVTLRDGDHLVELAAEVARLAEHLRERESSHTPDAVSESESESESVPEPETAPAL